MLVLSALFVKHSELRLYDFIVLQDNNNSSSNISSSISDNNNNNSTYTHFLNRLSFWVVGGAGDYPRRHLAEGRTHHFQTVYKNKNGKNGITRF